MLKNDEKMCTWSLFRLFLPLKPRMWHECDDENWFNQRWGARNIVAKLKGLTCVYSPVIPLCRCASRGMIDSIVSAFFSRNNKPEKREKPDCEGLTTSLWDYHWHKEPWEKRALQVTSRGALWRCGNLWPQYSQDRAWRSWPQRLCWGPPGWRCHRGRSQRTRCCCPAAGRLSRWAPPLRSEHHSREKQQQTWEIICKLLTDWVPQWTKTVASNQKLTNWHQINVFLISE